MPTDSGKPPVIVRKRYVIMRKNRAEIWCGMPKNFDWRPVDNVGDIAVKTYRSEAQAEAGYSGWDDDIEVVPVVESIIGVDTGGEGYNV